jgi:hypothetical protein
VSLTLTHRSLGVIEIEASCVLDADFSDIAEAQEGSRQQESGVDVTVDPCTMRFAYRNPELPFETCIGATGAEWSVHPDRMTARLRLECSWHERGALPGVRHH